MKIIFENTNLHGRYQSKVVDTEERKIDYLIKGWEISKITEDDDGNQQIFLVKKK